MWNTLNLEVCTKMSFEYGEAIFPTLHKNRPITSGDFKKGREHNNNTTTDTQQHNLFHHSSFITNNMLKRTAVKLSASRGFGVGSKVPSVNLQ
jgi:hypothetical protein